MITKMSYTTPVGASSSYEPPPDEVTVTYFPDPEHPLTPGMVGGFLFVFNIPTLSLGGDLAEKPAGGAGEGGNGENEGSGIRVKKM